MEWWVGFEHWAELVAVPVDILGSAELLSGQNVSVLKQIFAGVGHAYLIRSLCCL